MRRGYLHLYGGAIGDGLLGVHMGRVLASAIPGAVLTLASTRPNPFMRELAESYSFLDYRELPKGNFSSWVTVAGFALRPWYAVVYEPATGGMPLWWSLILWVTRLYPGGAQVRCQMRGHERPVPRGCTAMVYTCQTENFFSTPPRVLEQWGIPLADVPHPTLTRPVRSHTNPYLLFHFFAANVRRSIPIAHANDILQHARIAYPNHPFVLTCLSSEHARAQAMIEGVSNTEIVVQPTAGEMISLLADADMVVGTASGILLVAAHLGAPTVAMSCLPDPCWLPTFAPSVTILAARDECRCRGDKTTECSVMTPEGEVYRCLYFITTEEVLAAMQARSALL